MRNYYLAVLMLCVGACASAPEPAPRKRNVISIEHLPRQFSATARAHAEAHAKWLVGQVPAKAEEPLPDPDDIEWMPEGVEGAPPDEYEFSEEDLRHVDQDPPRPDGVNLMGTHMCWGIAKFNGEILGLAVERYLFGDGAAMLACNVATLARGYGGATMQSPEDVSEVKKPCHVRYDVDVASGGSFFFHVGAQGEAATATYMDKESPSHTREIALKCNKHNP